MLFNYKRYLSLFLLFTSLAQADSFSFNSGGAFSWKGSADTVGDLSATGNTAGDVRIVLSPFDMYGWDGASWVSLGGGGGGGITSLNGLLGAVQTFATGTAGTDFAISSVGTTHTFNIPTASAVNRGALSSANWTTFNNKEPAITATTSADYYRGDKTFQPFDAAAQAASISQVITDGVTTKAPSEDAVFDALALKQSLSEKNANNGYAGLDAGGKIAVSQLPNSVMTFEGQWNANTNTPALADGVGNAGDVWRANVAGTTNFGSGPISFSIGDWAVYNGTVWEYAANSNLVMSVNGQQGVVVLDTDDIAEGATNLYFTDARAIAAPITGFVSGAGVVAATDTILQAINKLDGNINAVGSGTANTMAVFDNSGLLISSPVFGINAQNGLNGFNTYVSVDSAGNTKLNNFEAGITNTADTTGETVIGNNFDTHFGRGGADFGILQGIQGINAYFSIENAGDYGNSDHLTLSSSFGDGVGGTADRNNTIVVNDQILTGFVSDDYRFLNGGVTNNGTVTSETDFYFQSTGDSGNYTGFQLSKNGDSGNNVQGFRFDYNGDVTNTTYGFSSNLQGTGAQVEQFSVGSSQTLTGNYFVLNSNFTGSTTQNYYLVNGGSSGAADTAFGLNFSNSGTVDYFQGVSLSNSSNGIYHSALNYSNTGDKSGSGQIINIQDSGDAVDETGLNINLTGAYSTSVKGLAVQVNGGTSPNQKIAAQLDGGMFQTSSPVDTGDFTPSAFFNNNSVGGSLQIDATDPLVATPGFGNNLGIVVNFDDDATADNFISVGNSLGFSINGFVNTVTGATGKTFDTLNYMFAGGSNPSGDGTIENLNFFRTAGLLNAGGALTATNMRGYYVDPAFDGSIAATNKWGFINASNSDNWFKKNVVIGGTSGAGEAGVELDVDGEARIRSLTTAGYVITDATGHLSSIAAPATPVSANITSNTTLNLATARYYFCDTTGGTFTVTLPAASSNDGVSFTVKHVTFGGANDVTVATTGGNTIDAEVGDTLTAGIARTYISNGTEWFIAD